MENTTNPTPKNILNRIYSAYVEDKSFKSEDGNSINYSILSLGLNINGSTEILEIKLPSKTNAKLLILASTPKSNFLEDDEIM